MFKTLRAVKFLFVGPLILALLFVINLMTSPVSGGFGGRRWGSALPG